MRPKFGSGRECDLPVCFRGLATRFAFPSMRAPHADHMDGKQAMRSPQSSVIATLTAAIAVTTPLALAANVSWDAVAGGTFTNGANWIGGLPPAATDGAYFAMPAAYEAVVAFDPSLDIANQKLHADNGTWIFDLAGRTYELTSTSTFPGNWSINLGVFNYCMLTIRDGTMRGVSTAFGQYATGIGVLRVDPDATLELSERLGIATSGEGYLLVGGNASAPRDLARHRRRRARLHRGRSTGAERSGEVDDHRQLRHRMGVLHGAGRRDRRRGRSAHRGAAVRRRHPRGRERHAGRGGRDRSRLRRHRRTSTSSTRARSTPGRW